MSRFAVGSLVTARGRDWIVLPDSDDELVVARPLGGTDDETAGILTALEMVRPATFPMPDPERLGDNRSARLLRDALRLGFRSSAGPFRSLGRIAVEPRPYQLVPLLLALRLDPVRLLIADDVGIGKTVEALLIARELLEQGDVERMAILCPPHLSVQWQAEMRDKFHLEATLVLPSTVSRLERGLRLDQSLFDRHPVTIISTDFIKAERRREEFVNKAPELIIVDEAHTCAVDADGRGRSVRQQRHELVRQLTRRPDRHLILVTATPHSGKEAAFRSLLQLLDPAFADLPDDLSGDANRGQRERLARHLVQRRRADIRTYLEADTPFPARLEAEETYRLSAPYRALFQDVLTYARESVADPAGGSHRHRVRYWSALALLRSLASSPAAAAQTLRNRAAPADTDTDEEADTVGRDAVLDLGDEEAADIVDVTLGADPGEDDAASARRLNKLARRAEALQGDGDAKLIRLVAILEELLAGGHNPIVFCRFIHTADYVADELRRRLRRPPEIASVTGRLPGPAREQAVNELGRHDRRLLVATDCLSEGINLQHHFDAVVHYDLSWNPTRHEQREGRVDRYGQPAPRVRVVTYYGADNLIDRKVNEVLLKKHRTIRSSLGVSIPVPGSANALTEALLEDVLLSSLPIDTTVQGELELVPSGQEAIIRQWEDAADREKRNRTLFAQHGIDLSEVRRELEAVRSALGASADIERFVRDGITAHGGTYTSRPGPGAGITLSEAPASLRDAVGPRWQQLSVRYEPPTGPGEELLTRTHPLVEALATHVLDTALDPLRTSRAARAGALRTDHVTVRTTLILCRFRFRLAVGRDRTLLAEDAGVVAFTGDPTAPRWLDAASAAALLDAAPSGNVPPSQASDLVGRVVATAGWQAGLDIEAHRRADELAAAHARVRQSATRRSVKAEATPQLPVDVLGVYVLLPVPSL